MQLCQTKRLETIFPYKLPENTVHVLALRREPGKMRPRSAFLSGIVRSDSFHDTLLDKSDYINLTF